MDFQIKHPKTLTDRQLLEHLYDMVIVLHQKVDYIEGSLDKVSWIEDETHIKDHLEDIEVKVRELREEYKMFQLDNK